MPKINLDEDKSLFSPLEFLIDGKTFTMASITDNLVEKIKDKTVSQQFSILAGIPIEEAKDLNIVKMAQAIRMLFKSMASPFKDELGEEGKKESRPEEAK